MEDQVRPCTEECPYPACHGDRTRFGSYLNGAVHTETIFGWDGVGRFAMEGIMKRDYPVIMGCIITGTVVYVLINLLVDGLSLLGPEDKALQEP